MKKVIIIFNVLLVLIVLLYSIKYLFDEQDFCLDTNYCKENLEINTEYGLIKINKENCIKYKWSWDEKNKYCNLK